MGFADLQWRQLTRSIPDRDGEGDVDVCMLVFFHCYEYESARLQCNTNTNRLLAQRIFTPILLC